MTGHNIQYFNKLSPNAHLHENERGGASRFSRSIFLACPYVTLELIRLLVVLFPGLYYWLWSRLTNCSIEASNRMDSDS